MDSTDAHSKKVNHMIRSLGNRIGILMLVLLTFSSLAHAAGGNSFRIILQDTTTGVQRVITDNVACGPNAGCTGSIPVNPNGDKALTTSGLIQFNYQVGNFFVTMYATSTTGADGGGILTMSATVQNTGAGAGNFVAFIEDIYGADSNGATASLTNTIGGYAGGAVTASAGVPAGSTLSVQSWLDAAGNEPNFGANSAIVPAVNVVLPGDPLFTNSQPGNTLSGSFSTPVVSGTGATSIFSEAAIQFISAGTANFTFTAAETNSTSTSVPEPASLLLLGSGLVGLGFVRKKKQI
jgi:hypothetical protein